MMSDACVTWGSDGSMPTTDALWFASPLAVGVEALGPVVAETRAIGGQHVTVFSGESALRRQILGTAQVVDTDANGCPRSAVQRPTPGPAGLTPSSLSVCVYSQDTGTLGPDVVGPGRSPLCAGVRRRRRGRRARPGRAAPERRADGGSRSACTATAAPGGTSWICTCGAIRVPDGRCR